jgi:hypothetical protein
LQINVETSTDATVISARIEVVFIYCKAIVTVGLPVAGANWIIILEAREKNVFNLGSVFAGITKWEGLCV